MSSEKLMTDPDSIQKGGEILESIAGRAVTKEIKAGSNFFSRITTATWFRRTLWVLSLALVVSILMACVYVYIETEKMHSGCKELVNLVEKECAFDYDAGANGTYSKVKYVNNKKEKELCSDGGAGADIISVVTEAIFESQKNTSSNVVYQPFANYIYSLNIQDRFVSAKPAEQRLWLIGLLWLIAVLAAAFLAFGFVVSIVRGLDVMDVTHLHHLINRASVPVTHTMIFCIVAAYLITFMMMPSGYTNYGAMKADDMKVIMGDTWHKDMKYAFHDSKFHDALNGIIHAVLVIALLTHSMIPLYVSVVYDETVGSIFGRSKADKVYKNSGSETSGRYKRDHSGKRYGR